MCDRHDFPNTPAVPGARLPIPSTVMAAISRTRRRRLWDLAERLHCPVIGVCLSVDMIRRLVARVHPTPAPLDDYDCHAVCVSAASRRGPLSEQLQDALERRHQLAIAQCRAIRDREALAARWQAAKASGDIASALWAVLTHPLLDADLEESISRDVHMIQHQAGAAERVDRRAYEALGREHAALLREYGKVQKRMTLFAEEKSAQLAQLGEQLARARGEAAHHADCVRQHDAELAGLRDASARIGELESTILRLQSRLAERDAANRQLQAALSQARSDAEAWRASIRTSSPSEAQSAAPVRDESPRTILCVGGRQGNVTVYREVVEQTGASFLYHDGGVEQGSQMLEAGLSAADVVICQTGCISHDAYWRVKDHCKRHGKQCLYVENPSQSAIRRELVAFVKAPASRKQSA